MNAEERSNRLLACVERIADALERAYPPPSLVRPPLPAINRPQAAKPIHPKYLCPSCNGPMTMRTNRAEHTVFWGCLKYPECKGTRNEDGSTRTDKPSRAMASLADDDDVPF